MDRDPQPQSPASFRASIARASRFSVLQHYSTPRERHGKVDPRQQSLGDQGIALEKKLGPQTVFAAEWLKEKLAPHLTDGNFTSWLNRTTTDDDNADDDADDESKVEQIYDRKKGQWKKLARKVKIEKKMYPTHLKIFTTILDKFVLPHCIQAGVAREVMDTHANPLLHKEGHHSAPDFIVRAAGNSFETSDGKSDVGWASVATFFEVKRDSVLLKKANFKQVAIYSGQIFASQPNRRFVRCMLLSEKRAILLHFDRAGHQVSSTINIHRKPETFVRMIVGLSSPDEDDLGLDTSIHWDIVDGKKASGSITMRNPAGQEIEYKLADVQPIAQSSGIRGRGTTCWAVKDPTDESKELIVKDSWSSEGRVPEHEHLAKAKDVKGIARMVSYEVRNVDTKSLRFSGASGTFFNKYAERVVVERYGPEIHNFTSALQVLEALRDVLIALKELFAKNIIHRDISNKNILLGREGDGDGPRGVVVDLGVALDFGPGGAHSQITKEPRSASRFFESIISLDHSSDLSVDDTPAHDFLDDLEGIFYVVCFLFLLFLPNGQRRRNRDPASIVIKRWDSELADDALPPKHMLFDPGTHRRQAAIDIVTQSWGSACGVLFESYLQWVYEVKEEKSRLVKESAKRRAREQEERANTETSKSDSSDAEMASEPNDPFAGSEPQVVTERKQGSEYATEEGEEKPSWNIAQWDMEYEDSEAEDEDEDGVEDADEDDEEEGDLNNPDARSGAGVETEEETDSESDEEDDSLPIPFKPMVKNPPLEEGIFASVQDHAEDHWDKIIYFFDTAIAAIKEGPKEKGPPPDRTPDKGKELKRQYSTEVSPLRARVAKASRVSQPSRPT